MTKIILEKIHNANMGLHKLVALDTDFLLARALAKLIQAFETDIKLIDKKRQEIFAAYCEDDEDGKKVIPEAKFEAFSNAIKEFLATEVELDFQPIDEELIKKIKLSAREYIALSPFLTVTLPTAAALGKKKRK